MDTHLLLYTVANVYPFFCIRLYTGPAAQTAKKQKSRTTKSPLMQNWVFKLGCRHYCCTTKTIPSAQEISWIQETTEKQKPDIFSLCTAVEFKNEGFWFKKQKYIQLKPLILSPSLKKFRFCKKVTQFDETYYLGKCQIELKIYSNFVAIFRTPELYFQQWHCRLSLPPIGKWRLHNFSAKFLSFLAFSSGSPALCVEMGFYADISWKSRCSIEINVWAHFIRFC